MTELKNCPFCGSEPTYYEIDIFKWVIMCGNDTCSVDVFVQYDWAGGQEEAIKAWNTRVKPKLIKPKPPRYDEVYYKGLEDEFYTPEMIQRAWKMYDKLKSEGKIPDIREEG